MSQNLMAAHRQWASRPADERFQSLSEMHKALAARRRTSSDTVIRLRDTEVSVNGDIVLHEGGQGMLKLTHWSAGQLLSKLGVPRDLLAKLTPSVASSVVNDRLTTSLKDGSVEDKQRLLTTGDTVRAFHGKRYERLFDSSVTQMLSEYLPQGWTNPLAYEAGKWGAKLVPSGLYAGDRNMFAFFTSGGGATEAAPFGSFDVDGDQFYQGFYVWNSEVGSDTFGYDTFNLRRVCGNHIIWDATEVRRKKARHAGSANDLLRTFRTYLNSLSKPTSNDLFVEAVREAKADIAIPTRGSSTSTGKEQVLDNAYKFFKGKFTQTVIVDSLDNLLREERGVKGSRWDWLQGLTATARQMPNADERAKVESTASAILLPVGR